MYASPHEICAAALFVPPHSGGLPAFPAGNGQTLPCPGIGFLVP